MKSVIFFVVLFGLALASVYTDGGCKTYSDCNAKGICQSPNHLCSCYSGVSGAQCNSAPDISPCTYAPISANSVDFEPYVELAISGSTVQMTVELPIEANPLVVDGSTSAALDTSITMAGRFKECNYPAKTETYHWTKQSFSSNSNCTDVYLFSIPWDQIGTVCGFIQSTYLDNTDYNIVQSVVNITRFYTMIVDADYSFTRSISAAYNLEFFVPNIVVVTINNIAINYNYMTTGSYETPYVDVISSIAFDTYNNYWRISILTRVVPGYKVGSIASVSYPDGTTAGSSFGDRVEANYPTLTPTCSYDSTLTCIQHTVLLVDDCRELDGGIDIIYTMDCDGGSTCITLNNIEVVNTIFVFKSCPISVSPTITTAAASYSDDLFTIPSTSFNYVDTAYFEVDFTSNLDFGSITLTSMMVSTPTGDQTVSITTDSEDPATKVSQISFDLNQFRAWLSPDPTAQVGVLQHTFTLNYAIGYNIAAGDSSQPPALGRQAQTGSGLTGAQRNVTLSLSVDYSGAVSVSTSSPLNAASHPVNTESAQGLVSSGSQISIAAAIMIICMMLVNL